MPFSFLKQFKCADNIEQKITAASAVLVRLSEVQKWPDSMHLDQAITQSIHFLKLHMETLEKQGARFLCSEDPAQDVANDMEGLFHQWHIDNNPPSLLAICLYVFEKQGLSPSLDDFNMVVVCAILGQVRNDVPYHNDMHFRKVLAQVIRMIAVNNGIYQGTDRALSCKQICKLLSVACIHDLGHDGLGNVVKGVHIEGRAERYSFDLAKPFLVATGSDDATLNDLYVMLLTTDVSPLDDPANPMMQMKAAYRYHFMGENARAHTLNLSHDISRLEKDSALTTMCLILHEADIATSAGLTYEVTKYETALLMEEFKGDKAYPSQVVDFLEQVCQRRFLSDAGQKLYAANMARIYALADQDAKDGDEPFSPSNLSQFVLPKSADSDNKTLN